MNTECVHGNFSLQKRFSCEIKKCSLSCFLPDYISNGYISCEQLESYKNSPVVLQYFSPKPNFTEDGLNTKLKTCGLRQSFWQVS